MPKIELIELHMASAHFPIALLMSNEFFGMLEHRNRIFAVIYYQYKKTKSGGYCGKK